MCVPVDAGDGDRVLVSMMPPSGDALVVCGCIDMGPRDGDGVLVSAMPLFGSVVEI